MTLSPDSTPNTLSLIPLREDVEALRCLLRRCPDATRAARSLLIDVAGNVVVFIPIGFSLSGVLRNRSSARRLLSVTGLGMALSVSIELIQLSIATRATDVDDVLFNTIGTAIGAALFLLFNIGSNTMEMQSER